MAHAHVNPAMLRWALARSSVSRSDLAKSLKKVESTIEQWLTGEAAPTFRQAQKLAKQVRVPFGYLFLEEPPQEDVPLPDSRRHPASTDLSLDLRDVISDLDRPGWDLRCRRHDQRRGAWRRRGLMQRGCR